jgi:hypothetical protein
MIVRSDCKEPRKILCTRVARIQPAAKRVLLPRKDGERLRISRLGSGACFR